MTNVTGKKKAYKGLKPHGLRPHTLVVKASCRSSLGPHALVAQEAVVFELSTLVAQEVVVFEYIYIYIYI